MSRNWYWLGAAMPLVIALTTVAGAEGSGVALTDGVRHQQGATVSLEATNVTLPELAQRLTQVLGGEVRIEGLAAGTVTVNLKDVPAATLLAQTAAALGGRWQTIYHLSAHEPAAPAPPASGLVLNLKMADVSCQAAAAVVARMAGGRLERDGELIGQVSLANGAVPVEEAMDAIAHAANASWRRIYVMKIDALPQVVAARTPDASAAKTTEATSGEKRKPATKMWSSHATSNGKPAKFAKRDWRGAGHKEYAPGVKGIQPKGIQPTLEEVQRQAMMGLYGNFFLVDSSESRQTAMKNFRAGLESQIKRLEALPANQRSITTLMTRRNFQRLVEDFANLDKDQKKEAQALYDYAKEQLSKPPLKP